ncbi:MAG TPA: Hpt domain-containing protein, partial [Capillimicrobium sp.]
MSLDAQLLAIFRQEADERLEAMVATLLAAEAGEGDAEAVRELFRHAHSLKGTAGMVGLDAIARIAAAMEDVLADARQSGSLDRALAGPLLVATDAVRATLGGEAVDLDAVVAALPAAEVVDVGPAERGELQPPALPAAPAAAAPAPAPAAPMLRVAAERVDGLLDAAGEAVLHRRRLEHLVRGTDAASDERVLDELERGEALLDGLQHAVLDLRTLPLASIVGRLPRAVRDVAASEGREVELELDGVDTQLDRTILDGLSDPLVHLLRNAVAHGIEPPDEREAAGKPRAGRLRLRAEAAGAYVAITVSDDGR